MQQIYRQTDQQFEVFTTVFSPQVCRSRTRTTRVDAQKVVVAVTQYRSRWPKELDLNQGDLIQVLCKEDDSWWFGRLTDGNEGYFPAACVEPLQGGDSSRAAPTPLRRGRYRSPGRSTPKLLRKNSIRRPLGLDGPSAAPPHGSPSLLHRVLAKSRRKSCPLLPHAPLDTGSDNSAFQAD
ncbi:jouberin [Micropterus salmoides]|uniref:jouberin n=1 Tax=Micropterus salmoides TaxID=27706 RepID=UPI0018EC546C|nr:jouberin [Micropterus salmoides]